MVKPYMKQGIAIINPYGGIWTNQVFDTPEAALTYLKSLWKDVPGHDLGEFKLAMAMQTTEVIRPVGDPEFFPMPRDNQ